MLHFKKTFLILFQRVKQCCLHYYFLSNWWFLVILHRTNRLYWVDYQLDQIGHIDIQGSDRQTFTNIGEITQPYSLTVYTGGFYT